MGAKQSGCWAEFDVVGFDVFVVAADVEGVGVETHLPSYLFFLVRDMFGFWLQSLLFEVGPRDYAAVSRQMELVIVGSKGKNRQEREQE